MSSLFLLKHGIVRVHDQHDLGDDEDEDKDEPADWRIAVFRSTGRVACVFCFQNQVTKILWAPL